LKVRRKGYSSRNDTNRITNTSPAFKTVGLFCISTTSHRAAAHAALIKFIAGDAEVYVEVH
jgi:hypothetical protein